MSLSCSNAFLPLIFMLTLSQHAPLHCLQETSVYIKYAFDCVTRGRFQPAPLVCIDCPRGGVCPGNNLVFPIAGYWSLNENTPPSACLVPEACPVGMRVAKRFLSLHHAFTSIQSRKRTFSPSLIVSTLSFLAAGRRRHNGSVCCAHLRKRAAEGRARDVCVCVAERIRGRGVLRLHGGLLQRL
jgi:hypothetical protein